MKKLMILIGLIVSATVYARDELHDFTLNGEVFTAVVISCDSQTDCVELLKPDGFPVNCNVSNFAEADRDYLKQWEMAELFMSPTRFVIVPSHTVNRLWRNETGDQGRNGFSTTSGVSEHRYYLTIYNLGTTPLENLMLNYQILYTQEGTVPGSSYLSERSSSAQEEFGAARFAQSIEGDIPVARLNIREWKVYATESAVLGEEPGGQSSSHLKIMVSMETADGTILTREVELPKYSPVQVYDSATNPHARM